MKEMFTFQNLPMLIIIALISFSLNLMNTGLDQVFNPALRD